MRRLMHKSELLKHLFFLLVYIINFRPQSVEIQFLKSVIDQSLSGIHRIVIVDIQIIPANIN